MIDLAGKDYFTEKEAAHYCCVSIRQFQLKIKDTPLRPGSFFGKNVYRRTDLQKIIEETAWQPSNGARTNENPELSPRQPRLIGAREAGSVASV